MKPRAVSAIKTAATEAMMATNRLKIVSSVESSSILSDSDCSEWTGRSTFEMSSVDIDSCGEMPLRLSASKLEGSRSAIQRRKAF